MVLPGLTCGGFHIRMCGHTHAHAHTSASPAAGGPDGEETKLHVLFLLVEQGGRTLGPCLVCAVSGQGQGRWDLLPAQGLESSVGTARWDATRAPQS